MTAPEYDVVVVGGGMVGTATASLLLREGFSVALIEAHEPVAFDASQDVGLRVSAISPGAQSILEHAGAWRIVAQRRHCAYRRMHVDEDEAGAKESEHAAPDFAAPESVGLEFAAAEFGMERLGTIVENGSISAALWQVLQARRTAGDPLGIHCPARLDGIDPGADRIDATLDSGQAITARLVVGADGPRSPVREFTGIGQKVWTYGQQGIVAVVRTGKNNPGVAWQRFMPGGPLAFLPLDDGSSSIVWTRPHREAERLLGLDDDAFCAELEAASGRWLGAVESAGPRAAFDLTMRLSDRYAGRRTVLVGDAAHVVHPLAGQGVNMGFLDAAALVELLGAARSKTADWGSDEVLESVLERYQRWRRSDAEVMARGIHGIRALFAPAALASLRRLGLRLVGKSWSAREAFLRRAAGLHDDAPALARLV